MCKVDLNNRQHIIYCKGCYDKELVMNFEDILRMDDEGSTKNDAMCPNCRE